MKIGFTGTQRGMTEAQKECVRVLLAAYGLESEFHHGDCIGADAEAHQLAWIRDIKVVIHPPKNPNKRAFCQGAWIEREPKNYLSRNHDIVDAASVLIATPGEAEEQLRSGTWATIRYARKRGKRVMLVRPDGSIFVTLGGRVERSSLVPAQRP